MENNNKILVFAIIIIAIAFLSFNSNTTGEVIKSKVSKLVVSPDSVRAGESLNIEINPGSYGVNRYVKFYTRNGEFMGSSNSLICEPRALCMDSTCKDNVKMKCKVPNWEKGEYYASVFDHYSNEYVPRSSLSSEYKDASFIIR